MNTPPHCREIAQKMIYTSLLVHEYFYKVSLRLADYLFTTSNVTDIKAIDLQTDGRTDGLLYNPTPIKIFRGGGGRFIRNGPNKRRVYKNNLRSVLYVWRNAQV